MAIKLAKPYEERLNKIWSEVCYDEKYMYYDINMERSPIVINESTWNGLSYVCVDSEDNIYGYIAYTTVRDIRMSVHSLRAVNFSGNKFAFARDLKTVIDEIFFKFNFRKISWSVIPGNPIERSYDNLCKRFGGRIVGTEKDAVALMDGKLYDYKMYELFKTDYKAAVDKHKELVTKYTAPNANG